MRFEHGESRYSRYGRASSAMGKRLVIYVVLLVGVIAGMVMLQRKAKSPNQQAEPIEWLLTFDEATAQAKAKNLPIMAYFFDEGNEVCRRMDAVTFAHPAVRAEARKFICVRIDGPAHPELVERYLAIVYPAVAFISPSGERLPVILNYRTPKEMIGEMREVLAPREPEPAATGEAGAGPLEESPSLPPRNAEPSRGAAE